MKIEDRNMINWELLAAYVSDNLDPGKKKEVEKWLAESEENRKVLDQAQKVWEKASGIIGEQPNSSLAWEKVSAKTGIKKAAKTRQLNVGFLLKVAAVFLVLLGIALFWRFYTPSKVAETLAENRLKVELPDGSVVTLNHNSSLKYPGKFSGTTREVTLLGEAFFSVKRNPQKPFIIHTGNSSVKVLGTSFNVNNYGKGKIEVVVNSGVVAFYSNGKVNSEAPVVLTKDQKIVYSVANGNVAKSLNSDPNYFSWESGKFVFRQTQLSEVFQKLEDFYSIKIDVQNDSINNLRFTSTFENQSADQIMNVLKLAFGLDVEHDGNQYRIREKN